MFTLKSAVILAIFGSAFAAPLARRDDDMIPEVGRYYGNGRVVAVVPQPDGSTEITKTITIVGTTNGDGTVTYTSGDDSGSDDTSSSTGTVDTGSTETASATAAASSAASTGSSDSGSDTGYMAIVNKWRKAGGLAALTYSAKLEANAKKTTTDGHGQMEHELNPGTFAQVLAPGNADDFEKVYVGGWLCEIPSLPGLDGICTSMDAGWAHDGETGHAEILTSKSYTNIGCNLTDGIWGCDLA